MRTKLELNWAGWWQYCLCRASL